MKKPRRIRVAVLLGGVSSEAAISRRTGEMVMTHLPKRFAAKAYDPAKDMARLLQDAKRGKIDVAFNALHGKGGEDGTIQGFLDLLRIPYTGSGVLASALAMDKAMSKRIYLAAGIPTPPALLITKRAWKETAKTLVRSIKKQLGSAVVVKPNASGSSVGVSVKPSAGKLGAAVAAAIREDGQACLVETFRPGRELTVGVIGTEALNALPAIEIRSKRAFFDYKAKYSDSQTQELVPAPIPDRVAQEAQALAIAAHIALGCYSYSRTDMIWHDRGIDVLETNTLPGLTSASLLPKAAKAAGIGFPDLLELLIGHAMQR